MINLNEQNFDFHLKTGKWIVDVWQEECGDCQAYAPVFLYAEKKNSSDIKFANYKVPRKSPSEFKRKYLNFEKGEVPASPTTMLFEDGKMIKRICGFQTLHTITGLIESKEIPDLTKLDKKELKIMAFDAMENANTYGALQNESNVFLGKIQEAINFEPSK